VGIAGVVGVLVALLAMATGFRLTLENTGAVDRAIVLRGGAGSELSSGISNENVAIVANLEGVVASSAELYTIADVPKRSSGTPANLVVRGVQSSAFAIRPEIRLVGGRMYDTGKRELIAGVGAVAEFEGIDLGAEVDFRDSNWTIVGIFQAGGGANESEVWTDLPTAQTAFRRDGAVSSMRLRLAAPEIAPVLAAQIEADPRLDLALTAEPAYYSAQAAGLSGLITGFGYVVATIMAIGAVFAALNTMYSAVSARTVEIATLRAIGFSGTPVVVSVMIEALLLAILGGVLGAALAYVGFNGATISTLSGFTQVAFDFTVTPGLVLTGIIWAVALGAVGGVFPAVRAARLPITVALRGE
jgi:putative ABC transport system permease protein